MPATVRPLAKDDFDRWRRLWTGYLTFYRRAACENEITALWRRLTGDAPELYCWVATDNAGQVVGIAHFLFHATTLSTHEKCYLQDLFVDPGHRACGAGRALIDAVYAAATAANACEVYWTTETDNTVARSLYDQVGELTPFIKYRKALG